MCEICKRYFCTGYFYRGAQPIVFAHGRFSPQARQLDFGTLCYNITFVSIGSISDMPKGQRVPKISSAPRARSAVSNRTRLFVDRDARGPWGRRYADLVSIFCDDLGGAACISELKLALVRRAAALTLEFERMEGELAAGKAVDLDQLGRLTGHLRRLSETLGTERVAKDVTPTLADVLRKYAEPAPTAPQNIARANLPLDAFDAAHGHGKPDHEGAE
jgi:hypothetical protein